MIPIYIDDAFKCHTTNPDGTFRETETSFFDGKCQEFVEGYRFVPSGESWTREDGEVFYGEMITPWKDFNELLIAQQEYENKKLEERLNAVEEELSVFFGM